MEQANWTIRICGSAVAGVAAVMALSVSGFSAYWTRKAYVLAPRRDVLRRYVGNTWRLSTGSLEAGVDSAEMWTALNEAKVVFGGEKEVVALLVELSTKGGHRETHERLAAAMAKASGFSTKSWPAKFIETAIAGMR